MKERNKVRQSTLNVLQKLHFRHRRESSLLAPKLHTLDEYPGCKFRPFPDDRRGRMTSLHNMSGCNPRLHLHVQQLRIPEPFAIPTM